jgi:hypothetical protein
MKAEYSVEFLNEALIFLDMTFFKNKELVGGILLILIFLFYIISRDNNIKRHGVFTIAKIIKYEGDADGASLFIDIHFNGKIFSTVVNQGCSNCIGKYFFVKILKQDPSSVIFYEKEIVPDCILKKPIPIKGWEKIPTCQ